MYNQALSRLSWLSGERPAPSDDGYSHVGVPSRLGDMPSEGEVFPPVVSVAIEEAQMTT